MSESPVLTAGEKQMIVSTYRLVVPISETVGDLFYRRLFEEQPQYRELFPEDMTKQKQKLMSMLAFITKSLDWTEEQWQEDVRAEEDLFLVVLALGRRHHSLYKIPDEAYGPVDRGTAPDDRGRSPGHRMAHAHLHGNDCANLLGRLDKVRVGKMGVARLRANPKHRLPQVRGGRHRGWLSHPGLTTLGADMRPTRRTIRTSTSDRGNLR